MNGHCNTCCRPVLRREDGRVLDPEPSALGIHLAAGGTLTAAEFRQAYREGSPRGHISHHCDPVEQQALFDIVMPPESARRGR